MNRGYIKFWRIAEDSRVWSRGIEYRGLLITLLTMANHKGAYFLGTKIERGQIGTSMQNLSADLGVSRQKLIRMFSNLEKDEVVKVKNVDNRFTLVTITNYNTYQGGKEAGRTTVNTTVDTTTGQQPDTIKEGKNVRSKKESYDSSPEQSPIAAGLQEPNSLDAVITLVLNTGEEHPVTQGELEQWKDLYPSVNVMQSLRNMKGWLIGNPKRRKTKMGISRFIQAWLAKEQDNPRASPAARVGPSRNGNFCNDGSERDYGTSDFGALGGRA